MERILAIDYDALAEYLYNRLGMTDDPLNMEFERLHTFLAEQIEAMTAFPNEEDLEAVEDQDLTALLFAYSTDVGSIVDITLTSGPGVVVRYGEHLLKLPLVLIKVEENIQSWRSQTQRRETL